MKKFISCLLLFNIILIQKIEFTPRGRKANRQYPLHKATKSNDIDYVRDLIEDGYDVNETNWTKDTPLHIAARQNYLKIAKYLVYLGADLNIKNRLKQTPLDIAIIKGHKKIEQFLIRIFIEQFAEQIDIYPAVGEGRKSKAKRRRISES